MEIRMGPVIILFFIFVSDGIFLKKYFYCELPKIGIVQDTNLIINILKTDPLKLLNYTLHI